MKVRIHLALIAALAALSPLARADGPAAPAPEAAAPGASPAPAPAPAAPKGDDDQTELGGHMEKMGKALKKLRKEVADPTRTEDSLSQLAVIEDETKLAATLTPEKTDDLPADQRAAFVAAYRKGIQDLQSKLSALEAALKAGNNADAAALVKAIGDFEKKEHKEFRKPKTD